MNITNFQIRIDTDLHQSIVDAAKKNKRSANAEYVAAVEYYLSEGSGNGDRLGRIERLIILISRKLGVKVTN